jgi:hypothetical protein
MVRSLRIAPLVLVFAAAALALATAAPGAAAEPPPTVGVRVEPVGDPTWRPVDVHLFSAPVGTAESGYAEFAETMQALLPPPLHEPNPDLGIGPGTAHQPPYDNELAAGIAAQGYREGVRFPRTDFSDGSGVWAVWMNVPRSTATGSSPDFGSGPIIPNSVFPIHVEAFSTHNGQRFSELAAFDVPPLDADVGFEVDGHSHFPIFLADNADFGPVGSKLAGSYRWMVTMTDSTGAGWVVTVHFAIAP